MIAPLYYVSPGQINAQVPFELSAGKQYQVIVNANGALSTPNPISLSAVRGARNRRRSRRALIIAQHLDGSVWFSKHLLLHRAKSSCSTSRAWG